MGVVDGWILEEDDPRRNLDAGANNLEDRTSAGAIGVPVDKSRLDVVPPTQRVEVELLVPIQGRLLPKPAPGRIWIAVDVQVVGVVVDGWQRGMLGSWASFDRYVSDPDDGCHTGAGWARPEIRGPSGPLSPNPPTSQ